jgi:hypothetical protein
MEGWVCAPSAAAPTATGSAPQQKERQLVDDSGSTDLTGIF